MICFRVNPQGLLERLDSPGRGVLILLEALHLLCRCVSSEVILQSFDIKLREDAAVLSTQDKTPTHRLNLQRLPHLTGYPVTVHRGFKKGCGYKPLKQVRGSHPHLQESLFL